MSARKGATLRALAERFVDGRLSDDALASMTDEEIEATLTEVSGIGPWTTHGFLIFALDRPDVLLSGDLACGTPSNGSTGSTTPPPNARWSSSPSAGGHIAASPSATCSPPNSRKEPDERNRQRPCGNPRRRPAGPGDGAHRAACRPLGRDRQQPRP